MTEALFLGRRHVQFSPIIHSKETGHVNDMSDEERRLRWYQPAEYVEIKLAIVALLRADRKSAHSKAGVSVLANERGLEGRTTEGMQKRRDLRQDALIAVMTEQARHDNDKTLEFERVSNIATAYRQVSQAAVREAQVLAIKDQQDVLEHYVFSGSKLMRFNPFGNVFRGSGSSKNGKFDPLSQSDHQPSLDRNTGKGASTGSVVCHSILRRSNSLDSTDSSGGSSVTSFDTLSSSRRPNFRRQSSAILPVAWRRLTSSSKLLKNPLEGSNTAFSIDDVIEREYAEYRRA